MKKLAVILIVLAFYLGLSSFSSKVVNIDTVSPQSELIELVAKMNDEILMAKSIFIKSEIKMFQTHQSLSPLEIKQSVFALDKGKQYNKWDNLEVVKDSDIIVIIDSDIKEIAVQANRNENKLSTGQYDLQASLEFLRNVTVKQIGANKIYTVEFDNYTFTKYTLSINTISNKVNQIVLFFSEDQELMDEVSNKFVTDKPRVELTYHQYEVNMPTIIDINTAKYVRKEKNGYALQSDFSNYELKDYTK